jgi:DNA-binding Lrp family transcriptional regulator
MEKIKLLKKMASKTAPGRSPDITQAHLLYTLLILNNFRISRKQLAIELNLGEGTVRTMLSRLQDEDLIEINRNGVTLSPIGEGFLKSINSLIKCKKLPSTDLTVDDFNFAVLVRRASYCVHIGVEQRDQAIIHGASGATTLIYHENVWLIPGLDQVVDVNIQNSLRDFNPEQGDIAIIGSSNDVFTAALGSLAAALDLLS